MLKRHWKTLLVSSVIVVLSGIIVGLLIFMKNQPPEKRGIAPLIEIASMEADSAPWGVNFPNQYTTYLRTGTNNQRTTYGGSEPFSKLDEDKRLVELFAGNPFSIDYREDRGHRNSLTDVRETKRLNDKTPASCYSCKTSNTPALWAEMGVETFSATTFKDISYRIDQPIGCANCHEANTMRLIVTNPALNEALKKQGKNWQSFTRQEMRSLVCANCHVEYYFQGDKKVLAFPWENGTHIEDIEEYYNSYNFSDWQHKTSGAAMIKIQHPEYEMFSAGSTHFNAGVACADCHMHYTRDGSAKFSSHDVKSPLFSPSQSCGTCHTDVNYAVERVKIIQESVHTTLLATEDALVTAIQAISRAASDTGVDKAKLEEARKLHRAAQIRWDFVAAENSMGFHNPEEALRILAAATDLARQAQLKAIEAVNLQANK